MIDKERVLRRLADIEHYSSTLRNIVSSDYSSYKHSEITTKASVERYLQLISDLELEVLSVVYKGLDLGIAGDEEPLISKFESMLSKGVISNFRKRRSLRNMLVRAYFDMHYGEEAFGQASNRKDVEDFVKEIGKILKKQSHDRL